MSRIPGNVSVTVSATNAIRSSFGAETDVSIVSDSGNADSGNTPTTRLRAGNVLVLKTSIAQYVEANDSTGDRATAPSKSTTSHTDGNGVIKVVGPHGTISVTTSTGTGTEANNATDLNADGAFAAHYVASSGGGELTIAARDTGSESWFYVHSDTMATAPFTEGEDNAAQGADADYVVLLSDVDQVDENGTAVDASARARRKGHFDESELINLTAEAKATLARRGSIFA